MRVGPAPPLAPLLKEAGVLDEGREVVFFGTDAGEEVVREQTLRQHFARSMSLDDAMHPKYQTKSFVTQSWYNTSSTSNRFSWRMPHDLMR